MLLDGYTGSTQDELLNSKQVSPYQVRLNPPPQQYVVCLVLVNNVDLVGSERHSGKEEEKTKENKTEKYNHVMVQGRTYKKATRTKKPKKVELRFFVLFRLVLFVVLLFGSLVSRGREPPRPVLNSAIQIEEF